MVDKAPDAFRTISEVADDLDLPQHVLRFWETRFAQIKPMKRGGGRRYYRPDDVDLLRGIRHLLYGEGYTIRGVQRILKDDGLKFVQTVWKTHALPQNEDPEDPPETQDADDNEPDHDEAGEASRDWEPDQDASEADVESPEPPAAARIEPTLTFMSAETTKPAPRAAPEVARLDSPPASPLPEKRPLAVPAVTPADRITAIDSATAASGALSRDDLRKLQATLFELGECRRLLDAAFVREG